MKLKNIIFPLCALLVSATITAQKVDITNPIIKKVGDNVAISFNAKIGKVPTNSMLTIIPVLWNGTKEQSLSPIIVMGRSKSITQARKGEEVKIGSIKGRSTLLHPYKAIIPFEKWMRGVSFRIDKVLGRCGKKDILASIDIKTILIPIPPADVHFESDVMAAYLKDFQQTVKNYPLLLYTGSENHLEKGNSKGLSINFSPGSSTIDESYMDNSKSISKIQESLEFIRSYSYIHLSMITDVGGSSPEGNFSYNEELSQNRLESLINYFTPNAASNIFEVKNIGENWNGLYQMVKNSNMEYKDEVLSIIDKYSAPPERIQKLMDLAGGDPYRHMYKEFFPELRKASYTQIFYDILPNDEFVKIDEASRLIKSKDYVKALDLLKKVTPTPYTDNLTGVCYMMTEDTTNAQAYLQRAIDGGSNDAQKNLDILNSQIDNIQYK